MADTTNNQFNTAPFLSQNQQSLLLAALASNQNLKNGQLPDGQNGLNGQNVDYSMDTLDPSLFIGAQQDLASGNFDVSAMNDQQFLDFMNNNGGADLSFDDGQLMGDGDEDNLGDDAELHDKRKNPEDEKDPNDNTKRREGEDKTAKKPGRKPLTSEPTTKRKAQNRAAQRAFRERKEKHLKDLETKVTELERASESANHENGLLRAQVARLQMELREYRKRLSGSNTGILQSYRANTLSTSPNNFQFDFPKFGSLPNGPIFSNGVKSSDSPSLSNITPGNLSRHDSSDGRNSPKSQSRANSTNSSATSPQQNGSISMESGRSPSMGDNLAGLFAPSTLNGMGTDPTLFNGTPSTNAEQQQNGSTSTDNLTPQSRIFQFNSNSSSDSPSASSNSQYGGGANSSCGTSPEPSHNSPAMGNKDTTLDTINEHGYTCHTTADGEVSFCEKLNMACGNIRNPTPRALSQSNGSAATPAASSTAPNKGTPSIEVSKNVENVKGLDWFANENGGQFDPVLFGDYRDSQASIVGDGDFTGGFFNDAMPSMGNATSPFDWNDMNLRTGLTPAVQKPNPLDRADALQAGNDDDEVVPGEDTTQMLTCDKIWDQIRESGEEGNVDIDGLCQELRSKARCSENGVVIDKKDVDEALKRLPMKRANSQATGA